VLPGHLPANPWASLTDQSYVFPDDLALIEGHNKRYRGSDFEIKLGVMPEPFIGSPDAKIWLLNLNPGFEENDLLHGPDVIKMQMRAATLQSPKFEYLDSRYEVTGGHRWWSRYLGPTIRTHGLETVMTSFFCVEYFPYHSRRYRALPQKLPSQAFTSALVKHGCAKQKHFIIMRQKEAWLSLVPELANAHTVELRNRRNVWISANNMTDQNFLPRLLNPEEP
jgi:hypothetical protein